MVKLGIIGLGASSQAVWEALSMLTEEYLVVAVCDKDQRRWESGRDITFCESSGELLENPEIESVYIAAPPATRFLLAMDCIGAGKHVLLESPATFRMSELKRLYEYAKKKEVLLHMVYPVAFGIEVKWFLKHQKNILQEYNLGRMVHIKCNLKDNDMALGLCGRLTDLSDAIEVRDETVNQGKSKYQTLGVEITVETNRDSQTSEKTTLLGFSNSESKILLNHTNQAVVLLESDGTKEELYKEDHMPSLVTEYLGVFRDYEKAIEKGLTNKEMAMKIHELIIAEEYSMKV